MEVVHPRYLPAGDQALVVEFGETIDPALNRRVRDLTLAIERQRHPAVVDLVPTYRSLLVLYDARRASFADMRAALGRAAEDAVASSFPSPRVVEIPTCYGGEFGPDLEFVARHAGLTPDQVVATHADTDYLVYMMGFTPGFTYLGGMSPRIAAPRLQTPRTSIPAGSVGIAQQQTGIYPVDSPGGWQLIGRTPVRLFDPTRTPPVVVEAGDFVRFVRVDRSDYDRIAAEIERGTYAPIVRVTQ